MNNRVSLLSKLDDKPGALHDLLGRFKRNEINLTNIESRPTKDGNFSFYLDFIGTKDDPKIAELLVQLTTSGSDLTVLDDRSVPWFPRHIWELDLIANRTLDAGTALTADHPGFSDPDYRAQRARIDQLARDYRHGHPIPTVDYSVSETETWRMVYESLRAQHNLHACDEYQEIIGELEQLGIFSPDHIPQTTEITDFLFHRTGFRLRPVAGLLQPRDFLNGLAFRVFFSTQYVRHHSRPTYTPEPDICHEFIGHAPMFADPAFADFLRIILKKGSQYFYSGKGLNNIFKYLGDKSCLSDVDFKKYKVYKRSPISLNFQNHTIYTNPSPSFGGNLIIFLLKLIKNSNKAVNTFDLIKGMNLASKARDEICTNPKEIDEISEILSNDIFKKYKKLFSLNKFDFAEDTNGFGSTTHVSIIDSKGNAASITTTNGEGCGSIIPDYGIMMNNMLGEVDINPFGFHNWNIKRRLPTMISPIIITRNSKPEFVLGSGGSNRIRSANIQVILNILTKNLDLECSINAPRLHLEGDTLFYEPGIEIPEIKDLKLISFNERNLFFGGVNGVSNTEAVGDQRRGGYGIIK